MSKKDFYQNIDKELKRNFNVNDTLKLLKHDYWAFASWGGHNFTNIQNKGLIFRVNGLIHKGLVLIVLGWNDTYEFKLLNNQYNEVHSETYIYADELFDRIDTVVEKQPYYRETIKPTFG